VKEKTISVNEAARDFVACVNRAHHDKMIFILLDNGVPVARLVPEQATRCSAGELADALRENPLTPEEARAWRDDIRKGRESLLPPTGQWQ
jgi:antitoxin (DNA-binding transcriptional repressor) of toxin-antitoxin stability system